MKVNITTAAQQDLGIIPASKYPSGSSIKGSIDYKGTAVFWSVAPAVWMYAHQKPDFRFSVSLIEDAPNIGREFLSFPYDKKLEASVLSGKSKSVVEPLVKKWLVANGIASLEQAKKAWQKLHGEIKKRVARDRKQQTALFAAKKKEGYRFVLNAWIHPKGDGDYQIQVFYKQKPTAAQVKSVLRDSIEKNDFLVQPL